MKTCIIVNI